MSGTLYGVGVGPGDPELVTRKAWRLIERARIIAYPAPDSGRSFARSIVAGAIAADAREIPMIVPMRAERFPAQDVYAEAAHEIDRVLDHGEDVVVLCEGDPFFYGSFMYLFNKLSPRHRCEIVPGVSSVMAVAAALQRPISGRNDVLTVIPATLDEEELERRITDAQAVAIMKLGRHMPKVRKILEQLGLAGRTAYAAHASLPTQELATLADAPDDPPYFSMLLLYKGNDPWLS
ncbi:MAG: precorrin-2 C(20)-methyltransferase [Geminicoccaceae bacterium]